MKLDELFNTVAESSADDWERLEIRTRYDGTRDNCHHTIAVYKPDLDISLTYGATVAEDISEPWMKVFHRPASTIAVWFCYRGVPVYERILVSLEGGRYVLPLPVPRGDAWVIEERDIPMAQALFNLMSSVRDHDCLDLALERVGLKVANQVLAYTGRPQDVQSHDSRKAGNEHTKRKPRRNRHARIP